MFHFYFPWIFYLNFFFFFIRTISYFSFKIVSNPIFTNLIFLLIFVDFGILVWSEVEKKIGNLQFIIANCYLTEMLLKMVAYGLFFEPDSYFRNKWNFLDFGVVLSIYFYQYFRNNYVNINISMFRNFIIMRLLKLPSFQIILERLFFSFFLLIDIWKLLVFFLLGCAILGVDLLNGEMRNKCLEIASGFLTDQSCGNSICGESFVCTSSLDNPDYGVTNFDNILYGALQILRIITLDNWSDLQILMQRSYSNFMIFYTLAIVVIGNFFMVNLMLAVLKVKYSECNPDTINEMKIYLDKYAEKVYDIQEIKNLGLYRKNRSSGIRTFGAIRKKRSLMQLLSKSEPQDNKRANRMSRASVFGGVDLGKIAKKRVNDIFNIKKLTNVFISNIQNMKFGNIISKVSNFSENYIMKMMNHKKSISSGIENLGKKNMEIRVKHTQLYTDDNLEDIIPKR